MSDYLPHPVPSTTGRARARQQGFTLVEAIMVIVIMGILGGIVAMFIRMPVQQYVTTAARAELSDEADLALRRIARDIRLALPNSVRVSADNSAVEFLLTKTGGRYWSAGDEGAGLPLDFTATASTVFTVVGAMPTGRQAIDPATDSIVVYNLGPGFAPADAYNGGNIARVNAVNLANNTITLQANPFAVQAPSMMSPDSRFQVVTTPVMYRCNLADNTLRRYWNYRIDAALTVPPGNGDSALLSNDIRACSFTTAGLALTHSGLVNLTITMSKDALVAAGATTRADAAGAVTLTHQIHVDNTP